MVEDDQFSVPPHSEEKRRRRRKRRYVLDIIEE